MFGILHLFSSLKSLLYIRIDRFGELFKTEIDADKIKCTEKMWPKVKDQLFLYQQDKKLHALGNIEKSIDINSSVDIFLLFLFTKTHIL